LGGIERGCKEETESATVRTKRGRWSSRGRPLEKGGKSIGKVMKIFQFGGRKPKKREIIPQIRKSWGVKLSWRDDQRLGRVGQKVETETESRL